MSFIAADIEKPLATVFYLPHHGGIEPRTRIRRPNVLSLDERELICRDLARRDSMRSIAKDLNRAASSISREIAWNGGINWYRAARAEKAFLQRAKQSKPLLLAENTMLRDTVCRLLREDWSPERSPGRLRESQLAGEPKMYVSHEMIYKSLFIQAKGVFREGLKKHLRTRRMFWHARVHRVSSRGQIADAISIRERPAEIEDRVVPRHWEGDLIVGANTIAIATVVERQSRFTALFMGMYNQTNRNNLLSILTLFGGGFAGLLVVFFKNTLNSRSAHVFHSRNISISAMRIYFRHFLVDLCSRREP